MLVRVPARCLEGTPSLAVDVAGDDEDSMAILASGSADEPDAGPQRATAVRDTANNRTGCVYTSVTVPTSDREPLTSSRIVVER